MKFRLNEHQRGYAMTAIWVFSICALIGLAALRWSAIVSFIKETISVLSPILAGLAMAYLCSPMQNWFEKKLTPVINSKKPHPKILRGVSVGITFLIVLLILIGMVASIVPELIRSVKNVLNNLPEYLTNITEWINKHIASLEKDQPQVYQTLLSLWNNAQSTVSTYADQFEPKLDGIASSGADLITSVTSGAISVMQFLTNFFLAFIIAIYVLYNKESYQAQARKLLYALLPEEHVHRFLRIGSHVSYTFMHFLSGKILDSFIIALLCFIGMTILRMPYVTMICIFIGITNIIPIFGPIFGAVPSALLILLSEPKRALPFIIFILLLQQFDGNILGPKILGDTLGLPMFWILFAIIVGGGMFGFIGMVVFVPMFAAIYALFSDFLEDRLKKKGLPANTDSYLTSELHSAKTIPKEQVYEMVTPEELTEFIPPPRQKPAEPPAKQKSGRTAPKKSGKRRK